jgi:hypothetical protein
LNVFKTISWLFPINRFYFTRLQKHWWLFATCVILNYMSNVSAHTFHSKLIKICTENKRFNGYVIHICARFKNEKIKRLLKRNAVVRTYTTRKLRVNVIFIFLTYERIRVAVHTFSTVALTDILFAFTSVNRAKLFFNKFRVYDIYFNPIFASFRKLGVSIW